MTVLNKPGSQKVWFSFRLLLTAGVLVLLWSSVGGAEIMDRLLQASPVWILAATATLMLQTLLSAQRWRITAARLGQIFPFSYAIREYFLSQAFNQTLPGAVVGDAARAVRARGQGGLIVASQAVLFERIAGQVAMFAALALAFWATSAVPGGVDWPPALRDALGVILALTSAAVAITFLLRERLGAQVAAWMRAMMKAVFAPDVLPVQLLYAVAITFCNLAAFGLSARAVGVGLSAIEIVALVPVILFAMLIPLTVSGWGTREGAATIVLPLAGISAADSVAASVMFGVALLISVSPGAVMVWVR